MKKKVTKIAEAKKVMKRNFKVNKKITFTDEGEVRFYKCLISVVLSKYSKFDSAADMPFLIRKMNVSQDLSDNSFHCFCRYLVSSTYVGKNAFVTVSWATS